MEDYELTLFDRVCALKQMDEKYNLNQNAYISFSGGKDSTALSWLIDYALPGNKIPRVFSDTGIEYILIRDFVKSKTNDSRFIMLKPKKSIKETLETYGYPFKSKMHSYMLYQYQKNGKIKGVLNYLEEGDHAHSHPCPKKLRYQFSDEFKIKISDRCCIKMKEEPLTNYAKETKRYIAITGILADEGGRREGAQCIVNRGKLMFFNPLSKVSCGFVDWLVERFSIELCKLYYPPFNFERTGCKGCPFNIHLQEALETLSEFLPNERKQCEIIWKPVYDEYRKIGYRLKEDKK